MNKLLAVFFIFLASWGVREVYFSKDSNRDIAYTIIAEQAYVFDVLDKDNVNNFHDFNPTRFIELKKKILISDYDIKDVKQQIKVLDKNEQMLIFALVAIDSIKQGKTKEFNDFILKSYMTMLTLPLIERDLYVYEIIRGLANIDNKLAQEYAVLFLLKQRNSSDKYLHSCMQISRILSSVSRMILHDISKKHIQTSWCRLSHTSILRIHRPFRLRTISLFTCVATEEIISTKKLASETSTL